jgi:hypothetical protein
MHVLDYTIITDPKRYNEIINEWQGNYRNKPDFNIKIKIRRHSIASSAICNKM